MKNVVVAEFSVTLWRRCSNFCRRSHKYYMYVCVLEITGDKGAKRIEVVKTYRANQWGNKLKN